MTRKKPYDLANITEDELREVMASRPHMFVCDIVNGEELWSLRVDRLDSKGTA